MVRLRFFYILPFFSTLASASSFPLQECGTYKAIGKLSCEKIADCVLSVYPGSRSEIKFKIQNPGPTNPYFDGKNVRIKIEIDSLKVGAVQQLTPVLTRALPDDTDNAFEILKRKECKSQ